VLDLSVALVAARKESDRPTADDGARRPRTPDGALLTTERLAERW
jgi:hypothetical protein